MSARIPTLRHHKPSGRAFIELAGKRHYVGAFGTPDAKAGYDRLLAEWLAAGRTVEVEADDITCAELRERFMAHAKIHYRRADGTMTAEVENFRYALRRIDDLYGDRPAASVGVREIKTIRDQMMRGGAARTYCNSTLRRLRHVFKWAASEGLIPATVHATLSTVAGLQAGRCKARENPPVTPVADPTVDAIRPYVSRQVWALIELQRNTGARPGELLNLRPVDIDMTGSVWTYSPRQHKTAHRGIRRTIYFGPQGQDVIRAFLAGRPVDRPLFSPREAVAEQMTARNKARRDYSDTPETIRESACDDPRKTGRKVRDSYTATTYARAIAYACDRAFPPPANMTDKADRKAWRREHRWTPNRLRHSAATDIAREYGVEAARIVLGHKSLNTTLVYAERDERKAVDIIAAVG